MSETKQFSSKPEFVNYYFTQWKEKYKFDDFYDFNIRMMFALQWDMNNLPAEHVKNRKEILDMIIRIQGHLPFDFIKGKDKDTIKN